MISALRSARPDERRARLTHVNARTPARDRSDNIITGPGNTPPSPGWWAEAEIAFKADVHVDAVRSADRWPESRGTRPKTRSALGGYDLSDDDV